MYYKTNKENFLSEFRENFTEMYNKFKYDSLAKIRAELRFFFEVESNRLLFIDKLIHIKVPRIRLTKIPLTEEERRICQRSYYKQYSKRNKDKLTLRTKLYNEKFPEKYKSRYRVIKAIKSGVLIRKPCEVCNCVFAQGHHDDYNKPLQVRWLCPTHHRRFHRDHVYNPKTFRYNKIT